MKIPAINEYERHVGKLLKIEEVPPEKPQKDYIFEEIHARCDLFYKKHLIKNLFENSDFYGLETSIETAINDAKEIIKMMSPIDLTILKGAIFSDDRKYRYALWRIWNTSRKFLMMIGLNPSVANELKNDPTITRGIIRSDREGYGGFLMANLFAYVSTDPNALLKNENTVGEFNDCYIKQMVELSAIQLCGWGSFKPVAKRCDKVFSMLTNPHCLGINSDGQPKHPLYVAYDTKMIKYENK
jgi:hypothetical protein